MCVVHHPVPGAAAGTPRLVSTRAVALLRGINLGGAHRVPMAELREVLAAAGCQDVSTYIQSGNVAFTDPEGDPEARVADMEGRMKAAFGFAIPTLVRTRDEWREMLDSNPFPDVDDGTKLHVLFLRERPSAAAIDALDRDAYRPDEFAVVGRDVYVHLPNGQARAKLPGALAGLGSAVTMRNWRTVLKLADMLGSPRR